MASNDPSDRSSENPSAGSSTPAGDDGSVDEVAAADTEQVLKEIEKKRSLRGNAAILLAVVGISFSAFQMWIGAQGYTFEFTLPMLGTYRIAEFQQLQVNAIHVAFALVLAFLTYPASTGEGRVATFLGGLADRVRETAGEDSGLGRAVERARATIRWALVDEDLDRIPPADALLILVSFLPALYIATQFSEIRHMRVRGLSSGRSIGEMIPLLEPISGPLGEHSVAFILGVLGVLLVLEATRRALGFLLMSLVSIFIIYAKVGYLIPRNLPGLGIFSITPTPWTSIIRDLWYNTEAGVFGVPVTVSVRFIYIFILFGAFLEMSGAGKWFIDLAYSLTGTRRGGPAKASVVSSGFMGMISGSSVANTVTTGAFTIPLMKRSGYTPEFAGAVESSVSSGGQILPPVMGAAAFLIVEFIGVPYRVVIVAAALPALAFFFGMWVMVHFEASKRGVGGLARSELLDVWPHMRRGWFYLVPVFLLIYLLVGARLSINRAGWYTIVATVVLIALVAAYDEKTRVPMTAALAVLTGASIWTQYRAGTDLVGYLTGTAGEGVPLVEAVFNGIGSISIIAIAIGLVAMLLRGGIKAPFLDLDPRVDETAESIDEALGRDIATTRPGRFGTFLLKSMDRGARTATIVVVAVAAAGVIPGIISVSGLGPNLTRLVIVASGESFLLLLILAGISALILGMGMPTTVMYIILVSVLGGALQEFGVALLAAHLFVLYFGLMADVTPPVMVAAYAGAGIAKSDPFETGKTAFLLSLNKIMVPFAFVFAPGILLLKPGDRPGETVLMSFSDVLDLSFFIPDVLIPVVGMFAGVYAFGVAIIGFLYADVKARERYLFAIAGTLLMVPPLLLTPAGAILSLSGVAVDLVTPTMDLLMRGVGAVMFGLLAVQNRRRMPDSPQDSGRAQTAQT